MSIAKLLLFFIYWAVDQSFFTGVVAKVGTSLAELPLEKLLNVKQALVNGDTRVLIGEENVEDDVVKVETADDDGTTNSEAMPLKGDWAELAQNRRKHNQLPARRVEDWDKGDSKGGISKIFQTTVTVLAFLAFGGYLLTMIVLALRTNTTTTITTTTATPAAAIIGRRKREIFLADDSPYVDSLTYSLHRIAEGYAKFHDNDRSSSKK